ncbi:MAG: hypothetical protein LBQ58_04115 [Synergistaceae bacterium]|jgi:hypothetical protein|nr:hypothetical protein [Synergistaceae bacterium]
MAKMYPYWGLPDDDWTVDTDGFMKWVENQMWLAVRVTNWKTRWHDFRVWKKEKDITEDAGVEGIAWKAYIAWREEHMDPEIKKNLTRVFIEYGGDIAWVLEQIVK